MSSPSAADFVLIRLLASELERGGGGGGGGDGEGERSRRPGRHQHQHHLSRKMQQRLDLHPARAGAGAQLMVFRTVLRAEAEAECGAGGEAGAGLRGMESGDPGVGDSLPGSCGRLQLGAPSSPPPSPAGGPGVKVKVLLSSGHRRRPECPGQPGLCMRRPRCVLSGRPEQEARVRGTGCCEERVLALTRELGHFTVTEAVAEVGGCGCCPEPGLVLLEAEEPSDAVLVLEAAEPEPEEEPEARPGEEEGEGRRQRLLINPGGTCSHPVPEEPRAPAARPSDGGGGEREPGRGGAGAGEQSDPEEEEEEGGSPGPAEPGRGRVSRCCSSPGSVSLLRGGGGARHLWRLQGGKGRKSSLRKRLSRLFRTKSCSGSSASASASRPGLDTQSVEDLEPRPGRLDAMSAPQADPNIQRKPRLTRTQSAFTPVSLAPPFTGETVSLVDLDISRRGPPSSHPPTPPPPPRRSLSLLDDIGGLQPVNAVGASLQSLPLPPPPPPHTSIQHSLSLNDTLLQNAVPQSREMAVQPQHCPLSRRDPNTFAASLRELEKCGWYWGPMNWDDAEMKLKGKPDGSFLVRDSSDPRYILSLSFRSQGITHHTRMEHYRGTFSLWCHPKFEDRCQSVVEFIERAIIHSKNGKFLYFLRSRVPGLPPTPVQLLYPVSRFSNVKSLQHLCRFRIRQLVRIDHIPELPLPKPLISYLRKFYYYDPEEEMYLSLKEARLSMAQEQDADSQT